MNIRKATIDDAPSIGALLKDLGYPSSLALIQGRIVQLAADPMEDLLVAASGTEPILGFISIHYIPQIALEGDFARISYFCVANSSRSQGVGRKLEEEATRLAVLRGCDRIEVHCHTRRSDAHRFYYRQGYVESPKYLMKPLKNAKPMASGRSM